MWLGVSTSTADKLKLAAIASIAAGIARVDYNFTTINKDGVSGTITLTVFGLHDDPQGSGGTVVGHFNFTGVSIVAP
jgi:hypothetical protein